MPSNNFFAEMLLKRLAADERLAGTRLAGAADVERFAHSVGTDIQAVDGSGLSRRNAVSPQEVVKLLVGMARDSENAKAFRDSLPVAGAEGTVADRMRGTAAEGNCATKTGTLDGVSALSGYCDAGPGTRSPSRCSTTASTSTPPASPRTGSPPRSPATARS